MDKVLNGIWLLIFLIYIDVLVGDDPLQFLVGRGGVPLINFGDDGETFESDPIIESLFCNFLRTGE
jgi:hypothetical protein